MRMPLWGAQWCKRTATAASRINCPRRGKGATRPRPSPPAQPRRHPAPPLRPQPPRQTSPPRPSRNFQTGWPSRPRAAALPPSFCTDRTQVPPSGAPRPALLHAHPQTPPTRGPPPPHLLQCPQKGGGKHRSTSKRFSRCRHRAGRHQAHGRSCGGGARAVFKRHRQEQFRDKGQGLLTCLPRVVCGQRRVESPQRGALCK